MSNAHTVNLHPARFSKQLLPCLAKGIGDPSVPLRILDPFAGTGERLLEIKNLYHPLSTFTGIEIQPLWASVTPSIVQVGNALALPFDKESFDVILTSPTYGNRMADHHEAKDTSTRNTYRHRHGSPLHPHNSGAMQWGAEYKTFHYLAWSEAVRVLKRGGRFILNIKDHIRKGKVQHVTDWHIETLIRCGLSVIDIENIACPGNKQGENGNLRVNHETVCVMVRI